MVNIDISKLATQLTPEQIKELARAAGVNTSSGMSEETKAKIRASMLAKNFHHTPEAKQKIRDALAGRPLSSEAKAKQSASMKAHYAGVKQETALLARMLSALQNGIGYQEWLSQLTADEMDTLREYNKRTGAGFTLI